VISLKVLIVAVLKLTGRLGSIAIGYLLTEDDEILLTEDSNILMAEKRDG
jgi:hypothetical protein